VALAVGQHRLKIGRRGLGVKRFAVGEGHIVAQGEPPGFSVGGVTPAGCQPGLYAAVSLILHQRFIDHALGKHLVGRIEMGIQRADVNRPGGGELVRRGLSQQRDAGDQRQQGEADNRQDGNLNDRKV